MITINLFSLIAVLSAVAGILFGYLNYRKSKNTDEYRWGDRDGSLRSDTQYIKRRIDDVLLEQKETNHTLGVHADRLARVEESVKQAHKRIDEIMD
mgnify:CR=1 FL=1